MNDHLLGTPRIQDPFGNLLAKAKGSVLVSAKQVAEAEVAP